MKTGEEEKLKKFITLPYVGRKCDEFATILKNLVAGSFSKVDFNVAFQALITIEKMFPFKDNIKKITDRSLDERLKIASANLTLSVLFVLRSRLSTNLSSTRSMTPRSNSLFDRVSCCSRLTFSTFLSVNACIANQCR